MRYAALLRWLQDVLVPPRTHERIVRTLTVDILEHLQGAAPCLPYADPRVQALIWEIKYYRNGRACALAGEFLSRRLVEMVGEDLLERPLLVPIPMHADHRRARGYNHLEDICARAMRHIPYPILEYAPRALMKIRRTPRQVELAAAARGKNLIGAYTATPSLTRGRTCIVVDDVTTTGATLTEAKRALREAGARVIETITLAH